MRSQIFMKMFVRSTYALSIYTVVVILQIIKSSYFMTWEIPD